MALYSALCISGIPPAFCRKIYSEKSAFPPPLTTVHFQRPVKTHETTFSLVRCGTLRSLFSRAGTAHGPNQHSSRRPDRPPHAGAAGCTRGQNHPSIVPADPRRGVHRCCAGFGLRPTFNLRTASWRRLAGPALARPETSPAVYGAGGLCGLGTDGGDHATAHHSAHVAIGQM